MQLINQLPFFYKSHLDKDNGGHPQTLPFYLYFDEELKMFRQRATLQLRAILNDVYKQGSLVEGSVSSESGKVYIEKVVNYLLKKYQINEYTTILEIGFGSGILLKELKNRGLKNLTGIEPGNHNLIEGLDGIKLVNDFFPSNKILDKIDLIYSFGILEHIESPVEFLQDQANQLTEEGKIIFSVPNCEPYIEQGDLSIFIHEHYSYFTTDSIIVMVSKSGLILEDLSVIEGAFICTVKKRGEMLKLERKRFQGIDFFKKCSLHIRKLKNLVGQYNESDIAIYAPARCYNALFLIKKNNVRLIDDNIELHRRYLPYLHSFVESFEDLLRNPPKCLIIFSRTFGDRIKNKCKLSSELTHTRIITLNELDHF